MKESSKDKEENKNKQTKYQLQEFNESEEDNFKTLNDMIKKMITINDSKIFFKQLGQFLGGLYNIALNREKLTGLKGFREKLKSSNKGVKGVKTYIDKFLKGPAGNKQSVTLLTSLINYIKNEIKRKSSKLSNLQNEYNELLKTVPEKVGYTTLYESLINAKYIPNGVVAAFEEGFGFNASAYDRLNPPYKKLLAEIKNAPDVMGTWIEGTTYVRDSLFKSQRNPNLKLYDPNSTSKQEQKAPKQEEDENTTAAYYKNNDNEEIWLGVKQPLKNIKDTKVESANSKQTYIHFGKFLGRLYAACEKQKGWKSIFSSSEKGASGAVGKIKEFLKAPGGSANCATALDNLMIFLLGSKGVELSSSRLHCLAKNDLLVDAWNNVQHIVVETAGLKGFTAQYKKEIKKNNRNILRDEECYVYYLGFNQYWDENNYFLTKEKAREMDCKFHNENFLPAKIKMAKIVKKECLSTYNKIKIESK